MTPAVFFYVSGHGFGHTIRQIAIIDALQRARPGSLRVFVRTSAPAWLFARTLRHPYTLLPGDTDPAVVQLDALRVDVERTAAAVVSFYDTPAPRVEEEAALLRAHDAHLVIADAPPLACAAAHAAGIPAVVCANFTWDWIYEDYLDGRRHASRVLATIREAYASAAAWRLPLHGGFDAISRVTDIPLVARHARADRSPAEVRRALGLPHGRPLALVSFGGYGVSDLPLDRLDCLDAWGVVLTTPPETSLPAPRPGIHVVREDRLYGCGLRYEDLVAAVDVVVTKPGYGIISDCAANHTAMLYTSRGEFAEYDVLVRGMPQLVRCAYIDQDALKQGRWQAGVEAAAGAAGPAAPVRTDGAEVAAGLAIEALTRASAG